MQKVFKKFLVVAAITSFVALSVATPAQATSTNPTVDYEFENSTTDAGNASTFTVAPACPGAPCNSSTGFGTTGGDGFWQWASTDVRGGGFTIDTQQPLTGTYTMMLKFSFTNPSTYSSWRKIIDFQDRVNDTGFYLNSGRIRQYPLGSNGPTVFPVNTDITLMVTRDATTKLFTVYTYDGTNFVQEIQVTDTNNDAIPVASTVHQGGTKLGFFFDDLATPSEATSTGKVYYIRLWAGQALTSADLQLQSQTAVIAPSSPSPAPSQSVTPASSPALAETGISSATLMALLFVFATGILFVGAAFVLRRKG
jgi:hypothetical protein